MELAAVAVEKTEETVVVVGEVVVADVVFGVVVVVVVVADFVFILFMMLWLSVIKFCCHCWHSLFYNIHYTFILYHIIFVFSFIS